MPKATQRVGNHIIGLHCSMHSPFHWTCLPWRRRRLTGTCQRPESQPSPTGTEMQPGSQQPSQRAPGLESWLPEGGPADPSAPVPILRRLLLVMFCACARSGLCSSRLLFSPPTRGPWLGEAGAPACRGDQRIGARAGRGPPKLEPRVRRLTLETQPGHTALQAGNPGGHFP